MLAQPGREEEEGWGRREAQGNRHLSSCSCFHGKMRVGAWSSMSPGSPSLVASGNQAQPAVGMSIPPSLKMPHGPTSALACKPPPPPGARSQNCPD